MQQRYEQPSSEQVGTWANAPYLIAPPQPGVMYIAEGPKKTLSLFVNGHNVIGLAGAFNYMNGNAHAQPAGAELPHYHLYHAVGTDLWRDRLVRGA